MGKRIPRIPELPYPPLNFSRDFRPAKDPCQLAHLEIQRIIDPTTSFDLHWHLHVSTTVSYQFHAPLLDQRQ